MPVMSTTELVLVDVNAGRARVGSAVSRGVERVLCIGARGLFRGVRLSLDLLAANLVNRLLSWCRFGWDLAQSGRKQGVAIEG